MIRDNVKPGWFCIKCGGNHPSGDHARIMSGTHAPLETPSHNGIYRGRLEVRHVAPGESGDPTAPYQARVKAARGNRKQVISRMGRKVECLWCERKVLSRLDKYCSARCRSRYNHEKSKTRPSRYLKKRKKKKWDD